MGSIITFLDEEEARRRSIKAQIGQARAEGFKEGYKEGFRIGYKEGFKIGYIEGVKIGERLAIQLFSKLFSEGRTADFERAASDREFREELINEFDLYDVEDRSLQERSGFYE